MKGVKFVNFDWLYYASSNWNSRCLSVDKVIQRLPASSSGSFVHVAISFRAVAEKVTKNMVSERPHIHGAVFQPGGYVIIYLQLDAFSEWYDQLYRVWYVVLPYSYVWVFNSKSVQNRNAKRYTQQITVYKLIPHLESMARCSFASNANWRVFLGFFLHQEELSSNSKCVKAVTKIDEAKLPCSYLCLW